MATLNANGGTVGVNMFSPNTVNHAAQAVPVNSSQYSWTTTSGIAIHAYSFADNITFNATSPLGGTVHALLAESSYTVGGMVGDLIDMTTTSENYWRAILQGETTIFASADASFGGTGDFVAVEAGENVVGSNDVFEGALPVGGGGSQDFYGDAGYVQNTATVTGGNDQIFMRANGEISGDAANVAGTLNGGNDSIVVDGTITDDEFARIAGDVVDVTDLEQSIAPSVVGGDDTIEVLQFQGGYISGDILDAHAALGVSFGGDDQIDASANATTVYLAGDIANLVDHEVRGGNDTLIGSLTEASLLAGDALIMYDGVLRAGADTLIGGDGSDVLMGDVYSQVGGTVNINATYTGDDVIHGGGGGDTLYGQVGDDILEGGMGNDFLAGGTHTGGSGDTAAFDQLNVAVSVDLLAGFAFGQGNDTITEVENIRASSRNDSLGGSNVANRVEGLAGNDEIYGRDGKDTLLGGSGNDLIRGGGDSDTIIGGAGADRLHGGGGADFFNYDTVAQSTPSLSGRDLIETFVQGVDLIDVSGIDAQAGLAGNQAFAFIGAAAFSAEGQIRAVTSGGHTLIQFNTIGTGGSEMTIELDSVVAVAATDFVL